MPLENCQENGKPGYKWGEQGACYVYNPDDEGSKRNAKKKAILQGVAIGEYWASGSSGDYPAEPSTK